MQTQAETEQQPRRYQPHTRKGQNSPRITVVLPADCAEEVRRRASAQGKSESGMVAALVAAGLEAQPEQEGGGQTAAA